MSSLAATHVHSFTFASVSVAFQFAFLFDPADALSFGGLYILFSFVVFCGLYGLSRNFRAVINYLINRDLLVCRARGFGFKTVSCICDAKLLDFHSAVCAFIEGTDFFIVGECL